MPIRDAEVRTRSRGQRVEKSTFPDQKTERCNEAILKCIHDLQPVICRQRGVAPGCGYRKRASYRPHPLPGPRKSRRFGPICVSCFCSAGESFVRTLKASHTSGSAPRRQPQSATLGWSPKAAVNSERVAHGFVAPLQGARRFQSLTQGVATRLPWATELNPFAVRRTDGWLGHSDGTCFLSPWVSHRRGAPVESSIAPLLGHRDGKTSLAMVDSLAVAMPQPPCHPVAWGCGYHQGAPNYPHREAPLPLSRGRGEVEDHRDGCVMRPVRYRSGPICCHWELSSWKLWAISATPSPSIGLRAASPPRSFGATNT